MVQDVIVELGIILVEGRQIAVERHAFILVKESSRRSPAARNKPADVASVVAVVFVVIVVAVAAHVLFVVIVVAAHVGYNSPPRNLNL